MCRGDEWVLLADDDEDIRETIESLLTLRGHRVVSARDGAEALERMRERNPPAMVLLDLMMPGMNGEEFRAAQLADPALASVPVVVLSGAGHIPSTGPLGRVPVLAKPIDLDVLFSAVEQFCSGPGVRA
jgi:CheY-like chemotaxis protein